MLDHVTIDGDDRVGSTLSIPTQELEAIEKLGSSSRLPNSDKYLRYSWSVQLQSATDIRSSRQSKWTRTRRQGVQGPCSASAMPAVGDAIIRVPCRLGVAGPTKLRHILRCEFESP